MPLEKVGLEAILLTDEFEKGRKIYERGLARTNSATKKTADAMSKTGKTMTAGWQSAAGGGFGLLYRSRSGAMSEKFDLENQKPTAGLSPRIPRRVG